MNEEAALLAAILAQPDDDTARLVYADWLDEHDRPERAEFIRVQYRLAAETTPVHRPECRCEACALVRREFALAFSRGASGPLIREWAGEPLAGWEHEFRAPDPTKGTGRRAVWARGFVAELRLEADDWLAHADAILARHPVRRVGFLSRADFRSGGPFQYTDYSGGLATVSVRGRREHRFDLDEWMRVPFPQNARMLLAAEWPGIAFDLPV